MYSFGNADVPVFFKNLVKLGVLNSYEEPQMISGTSRMNSDLQILTLGRRPPGEGGRGQMGTQLR